MLKDDFYLITDLQSSEGTITATLKINPAHKIFKGHFPGQLVVPGVCLMQIVKEVLEVQLKKSLILGKADFLKFINPVIPNQDQLLQLKLKYILPENQLIKISATITAGATAYFKFQGYFAEAQLNG